MCPVCKPACYARFFFYLLASYLPPENGLKTSVAHFLYDVMVKHSFVQHLADPTIIVCHDDIKIVVDVEAAFRSHTDRLGGNKSALFPILSGE